LTERAASVKTRPKGDGMQTQEFDEILASLQQIVRQAYTLGRSDALKQVVEVLKADAASAKPLALMGPADEAAPLVTPPPQESAVPASPPPMKASNDDHGTPPPSTDAAPWWARQPRSAW
jgi:hypothetical protein